MRGPAPVLVLLLTLAGCGGVGEPPVLGVPGCLPEGCVSPENPLAVRLKVAFEDPDGDLAGGVYWAFHGSRQTAEGGISERLEAAGLALDAIAGELIVDVPLEVDRLAPGKRFEVSVQLEDAEGNESNRPGLVLEMTGP